MGMGFENLVMLLGLVGIGLPVVAHLLTRRRHNVVHWGAMRFLQLGNRTRRRLHFQDLLLLLLRMGLIACLAIGLARPWGSGSFFGWFSPPAALDIVFIIDGSGSMEWQGTTTTPHQQATQWIHQALEDIRPEDTVSLIDARKSARRVLNSPTSDLTRIREDLARLSSPTGISHLPQAIEEALKVLTTTVNPSRKIVVLTDDQALAWHLDDPLTWKRIAESRKQFHAIPSIHLVSVGRGTESRQNFSVSRLKLSREMTVPDFPIKVQATVRQSGGTVPVTKLAFLEIDGQQVPGQSVDVVVPPDGEVAVEFDAIFSVIGEYVVSVVLDPDLLPVDDRADGVVNIIPGLPVLIVDGDTRLDAVRSESFYVHSAFASSGKRSPWVQSSVISESDFHVSPQNTPKVIFLLNVKQLTSIQWDQLKAFVREGGGLVIAAGDRTDAAAWNRLDENRPEKLLPARFDSFQRATGEEMVTINSDSLTPLWLQRFRQETGVDLLQSRFGNWWKLENNESVQVLARNSLGEPFIVSQKFGRGEVIQLAFPLDADGSTFPAKGDFVPFLHEMTFHLAGNQSHRHVEAGTPLQLRLPSSGETDVLVSGPGFSREPALLIQKGQVSYAVYRNTTIPGVYQFERAGESGMSHPFVVLDDRSESDLTPLSEADRKKRNDDYDLSSAESFRDVLTGTSIASPRVEFWWVLMLVLLGLLVSEAALTRRMVRGIEGQKS
ncbi:MAG TPA: BatA domain-containing protein [Planctomicrobium sp.]|nr:BatA domain-containing protein [Planctomicrobium sp.]